VIILRLKKKVGLQNRSYKYPGAELHAYAHIILTEKKRRAIDGCFEATDEQQMVNFVSCLLIASPNID
jgi:hypothetical protein